MHVIGYDLIKAEDGEHERMRTKVMAEINGAKQKLDTLWAVPTKNRTSQAICADLKERIKKAKIRAKGVNVWIAHSDEAVKGTINLAQRRR